jgi:deoxyribodipyrimidine photolyase-related protein
MIFLILPHQLFHIKYLKDYKDYDFYIYEHPQYFKKYKFNKKKLMLHRASMKYYYDYLKDNDFKVKYFDFDEKPNLKDYILFDPIDEFSGKYKLPGSFEYIETPNFLLTKEQYGKYRKKTDKYMFTNFYMWSKKELDLYPTLKSRDKFNREQFKKNLKIPKLPKTSNQKYIISAKKYVDKKFPRNYGNTDNFIYPIDHKTAKKWLLDFFKKRLKYFGPYQDFVQEGENFMFHSVLSSSINIGLINPSEIVDELAKYKNNPKIQVNINSFEGYLRQLFWREYQRYTYIYVGYIKNDKLKFNYFGNRKKLNKDWYEGTLDIEPIDDMIKDGFNTGYLHHIGRLMFVGNFMNLYGISPMEGFKWFMEFSTDSYEWVMCQNVLDMVFFCTGGMTMRKPYATSSNYVLKMSSYKYSKNKEWTEDWDNLYTNFMKKNKKKLWKFRYHFPALKKI